MSLSLAPSADGSKVQLLLGATIIGEFSITGVEQGAILASALEAQGLANAKKLLTPDTLNKSMQGGNQSLAANGYQKLPGGLIIQWGKASFADMAGTTSTAVVFPVTFPNSVLNIVVTAGLTGGFNVASMVSESSINTSGFTGSLAEISAVAQSGGQLRWIAIGN